MVVFLAEDEDHHVGVLLDRAGFTQVRELRPLVVAAFDLPRELRQGEHGHIQLLGQRLQLGGNFGDFLHPVFGRAPRRALQKLNIIDDEKIQSALALQPPRAGRQLRDREPAGLIDIEGQVLQFDRDVLDLLEIRFGDAAAADLAGGDFRLLGNDTGGELLGGHFQREEADNAAIYRPYARRRRTSPCQALATL